MVDQTLDAFTAATAKPGIFSLVFLRDADLASPQSRAFTLALLMEKVQDGLTVKSMALSSPTSLTPSKGDAYVVAPTGTSAWAGEDNSIAIYDGSAWAFSSPVEGWRVYDQNTNAVSRYDGSAWGSTPASTIGVSDSGGYFTGTDVEAALQEAGLVTSTMDDLATEGGAGIAGIAETYGSRVSKIGDIYKTEIIIDLTGLNCGGTAGDIIGDDGTGAAYIARITAAECGTIFGGRMTCLEAPGTGDADIDLYAADEGTGVEDTAIATLTETQIINSGSLSLGTTGIFAAMPGANQYLYLVGQGIGNTTYTAGKLLIEMWGT